MVSMQWFPTVSLEIVDVIGVAITPTGNFIYWSVYSRSGKFDTILQNME